MTEYPHAVLFASEEVSSFIEHLDRLGLDERLELYSDLVLFERVELIVFAQRFSAVAWFHEYSASDTNDALAEHRRAMARGEYVIDGWGIEPLEAAAEQETTLERALTLQYGSFELMAIAALETLFGDLLPLRGRPRGLLARFRLWADAAGARGAERELLGTELARLAELRNRFAHELDGSPWEGLPEAERDRARVVETLLRVAGVVRGVDAVLKRENSHDPRR